MASIFSVSKPKKFEHTRRFGNERKEYLDARVRKIKREMGLLPDEEFRPEESIRGTFAQGTTHLRRRLERDADNPDATKTNRYVKLGVALILLSVVFYYLIK